MAVDPMETLRQSRKYAETRLGAQKDVAMQRLQEQMGRQQAIAGGPTGTAQKIARKSLTELQKQFGEAEAGMGAQFAQQEAALAESEKQRQFAAEEAAKSRTEAARQFDVAQLGKIGGQSTLQARALDDEIKFRWDEFSENQKTNIVNAVTAMAQAGMDSPENWAKYGQGLVGVYGPERVPQPTAYSAPAGSAAGTQYSFTGPPKTQTIGSLMKPLGSPGGLATRNAMGLAAKR